MRVETSLPVRSYVPRDDIRIELHTGSWRPYCQYKGQASYWSAEFGERRREEDLCWSCEKRHKFKV